MVEKGFVTEQDFREFTFTNAAMLHMRNNPGFVKDTVVEQAVAEELALEIARRTGELSIAFLIEENPGVAFDGSGNAGAR